MPGSNQYSMDSMYLDDSYKDTSKGSVPSGIPINSANTHTNVNNNIWSMEDSQYNRQTWYGEDADRAEGYYNEARDMFGDLNVGGFNDHSYNYVYNKMNDPYYYLNENTSVEWDPTEMPDEINWDYGNDLTNDLTDDFTTNKSKTENYNELIFDGVKIKGNRVVEDEDFYLARDANENAPLVFFPYYKISDYSKDLNNFRKQINPFGQKGCFYFKIFFSFNSGYGLLGNRFSPNTALHYLDNIKNLSMYKSEQINDKINALEKFINTLKVLSVDTPWFFKEVSNLNNINDMFITDEDFGAESFVNVHCNYEATDMRLGTLFNLYKFACYNSLRNKEILPPNLRKFDMSILFMHVPLKNYHTGFDYYGTKFDDKELLMLSSNDMRNIMSVKMLTFYNCEFDVKSMNELNDSVSNETMFELGGNILKINYGRVYEHRINEFEGFGVGPDGFIFDLSNEDNPRLGSIANLVAKQIELHNPIPDDSEAIAKHIGSEYYTNKIRRLHQVTFNPANIYSNFTNVRSHYYQSKIKNLKNGNVYKGNLFGLFDIGKMDGANEHRAASQYNLYKKKAEIYAEHRAIDPIQNLLGYTSSKKNLLNKVSSINDELKTVSQKTAEYGISYGFNDKVSSINDNLKTVSQKTAEYGISYNISDKIDEINMKLNKNPESGSDYGFSYDLTGQVKDIEDTLAKTSEFGSDYGNSYYLASTLENIKDILGKTPEFANNSGNSYYLSYTLDNIDKILNKASEFGSDYGNSYYLSYTLDNIEKILNKPQTTTADRGFSYDLEGQVKDIKDKLARVSEFLTDRGNSYDLKGQVEDIAKTLGKISEFKNDYGNSNGLTDKVDEISYDFIHRNRKHENIYGYNYGRVGYIMENRVNSYYLTEKLRQLKKSYI